jgi:hypothetical protein
MRNYWLQVKKKNCTVLNHKNNKIMKTICLIFIYVTLSFFKLSNANSDSTATITVKSSVPNQKVYLNRQLLGSTPIEKVQINPGSYQLWVQSVNWPAWNEPQFEKEFTAIAGQKYQFSVNLPEKVYVNSVPYGATVYVNDKKVGETPVYVSQDTASTTNIRLEKKGYNTLESTLSASLNQAFPLYVLEINNKWQKDQNAQAQKQKTKLQNRRKLLLASLAFTVVAGLATINLRSAGNDAYSDYQETAIPSKMNDRFEKAKRYDRLAGISYALFECGFVLSGYFFLSSRK